MAEDREVKLQRKLRQGQVELEAELEIAASTEEVWRALTEGEEIRNWFAFQAESDPRPNGTIWMSWDGEYEGKLPILVWEPEKHLRTGWPVPLADGETVDLIVDYHLEGKGGATVLRLVHSGFSAEDEWEEIVDSHRRGWANELRSLRHYLENHPRRHRGVVKVRTDVAVGVEEAWQRLWSANGWLQEGRPHELEVGDPFSAVTRSGERLTGTVQFIEPPTDLLLNVESMQRALLRIQIEVSESGKPMSVRLFLLSWTLEDSERDRLERLWQGELDAVFAVAGAV